MKTKENHRGNEAEPPSIEKYLRTLMAKKLHSALLVPQKIPAEKYREVIQITCDYVIKSTVLE